MVKKIMKYHLYVDEVGNSDLGTSHDPSHRYLSLTGIILESDILIGQDKKRPPKGSDSKAFAFHLQNTRLINSTREYSLC